MTHTLPKLPYAKDALAPYISEETLSFHYDKHHQTYVTKLNGLIEGTPLENATLEAIMSEATGPLYNNAAQVWNHTFYWNCLSPNKDQQPTGALLDAINQAFGDLGSFKKTFSDTAMNTFGSGWAWLVRTEDGTLAIRSSSNAHNPMNDGEHPLLTCDVWEHAYYIDTQNNRAAYIDNFWHLVNWAFVAERFAD